MNEQTPYEILGVSEESSFEEIQDAKNRLIQEYKDNNKVIENIETAYDAIIMERLRMRQEGKIKVPDRIRFPERSEEILPTVPSVSLNNSPSWLQRLIDTPSSQDLIIAGGVFAALVTLTIFAQVSQMALILVLGVFANVYLLNRKEQRFGRSLLMTLVGLLIGVALGTGLTNLMGGANLIVALREDQLASIVTLIIFWLISSFLR
ncbi:heat shock protein DnaJ domain protein [Rippkaea orientalis PCC 8801]|uniref:Heat shock protein DnaJ domain protein n=1 Tax=Rippkaea orientalis (strain PCC 8801 / RF-1) TaxID=41431 RepID=B7JW09_RIPO1|nr:CPP1-like family protein [Rippkaea orientalis]ACK65698.1 heat shock protein DnaJ domain protein [Rippkaea orientalis PCC 8801]